MNIIFATLSFQAFFNEFQINLFFQTFCNCQFYHHNKKKIAVKLHTSTYNQYHIHRVATGLKIQTNMWMLKYCFIFFQLVNQSKKFSQLIDPLKHYFFRWAENLVLRVFYCDKSCILFVLVSNFIAIFVITSKLTVTECSTWIHWNAKILLWLRKFRSTS